ncbi:MAG: polyribonucleotide nucleotidyltransferase, partial [Chloroflexi bacterium]|nr:polyribonucleotide nucleotidyltransferase [Chloroflexota bacterium]
MIQNVQANIAGKTLSIETGKLAFQANGAVVIHYGDTVVLVTANSGKEPREGDDFAPLTVDYEEKLYAAGKIPGGFFKREGRPGQEAILTSRLTDRPLRPLFPKGYRNEVQIIITVLSADQENDPDILAIIGASSALGLSDIPYATLIAASRIGYVDGQYLVNPTYSQLSNSVLDIIVASTFEDVIMVEAGAKGVSEEVILGAIGVAHETNKEVIKLQRELIEKCGKPKLEIKP